MTLPTPPRRCAHALRLEHCATCSTRQLLTDVTDVVDKLAASLLPGTTKPWTKPPARAERTPLQREQARLEREQRVDLAPGETPAPLDLDVMDVLEEILTAAVDLARLTCAPIEADLVAWAGSWARSVPTLAPPAPRSAYADPRVHLNAVAELLEELARVDADELEMVAYRCERLLRRAHEALGLVTDGQLLDALCPWCGGATGAHPVGGAKTLRVRTLPGGRPVVVCEGGRCEPSTADCGIRWRGLPAWDLQTEGEWLADRIARAS